MKKNIFILLAYALCLTFFSATISADSSVISSTRTDNFILKKLTQNTHIMDEVFAGKAQSRYDENSFVQISIGHDKKTVSITLFYNGTTSTADLDGTYNEISLADAAGYIGVYEGFISPTQNNSSINADEKMPIIADITFTDSDIFSVLTIGYADETRNPNILFYGDYTKEIAEISKVNATQFLKETQKR